MTTALLIGAFAGTCAAIAYLLGHAHGYQQAQEDADDHRWMHRVVDEVKEKNNRCQ